MAALRRDVQAAAARGHEVIVVGGGIHGAAIALELATQGIPALLLERGDFASGTTANWLRIVHGGLRYLQSADLVRFAESVRARRAWLAAFPDLVDPLPCLMPLYGRGLKRLLVLRAALAANEVLSRNRNAGVPLSGHLRPGQVLDPAQTLAVCGDIRSAGLNGAAQWFDGIAPDANRLALAVLKRAAQTADVLNHIEVQGIDTDGGAVTGVRARDAITGETMRFSSPQVIVAAGQWCGAVAQRLGVSIADDPWALAWNLVVDRAPPADHALAVAPPQGGQVFFLVPCRDRLLVGTGHATAPGGPEDKTPDDAQIGRFLEQINAAMPALALGRADVLRVYSGLQPGTAAGAAAMATRSRLIDHGQRGGPRGLHTVIGIKYTTSTVLAAQVVRRVFGRLDERPHLSAQDGETPEIATLGPAQLETRLANDPDATIGALSALARDESAVYLDDLLLRRTQLADDPRVAARVARSVASALEMEDASAMARIATAYAGESGVRED